MRHRASGAFLVTWGRIEKDMCNVYVHVFTSISIDI